MLLIREDARYTLGRCLSFRAPPLPSLPSLFHQFLLSRSVPRSRARVIGYALLDSVPGVIVAQASFARITMQPVAGCCCEQQRQQQR